VIEDLPTHAHGAGITGMVQGVIRLALMERSIQYRAVAPAVVKKYICGRGNATKADIRLAIFQRTGLDIRDDNQADAFVLRHIGLHLAGVPQLQLPKAHTECLSKIEDFPT
jgi:Holliday junction resolvasome RuvABC endonuclease subunit